MCEKCWNDYACQCPDCQGTRLNPCREDCPQNAPARNEWLELLEAAKTLIGLHPEAHPIAHAHALARLSRAIEAIDNQIP